MLIPRLWYLQFLLWLVFPPLIGLSHHPEIQINKDVKIIDFPEFLSINQIRQPEKL